MSKKDIERETVLETYLIGMKASIVSLYILDGNKMPDSARRDLEEIEWPQIFMAFERSEIDKWIRINHKRNFRTFHHYSNYQIKLNAALTRGNNPEFIASISKLPIKDKIELQYCFDMWDAAHHAFIVSLGDENSINLLLKYNEQLRQVYKRSHKANKNAKAATDNRDATLGSLSNTLRQRKKDLNRNNLSGTGIIVSGTLPTPLSSQDWIYTLQNLSSRGYVDNEYYADVNLIERWLYFALSFPNEAVQYNPAPVKLKWSGTPLSLAEFLIKMNNVGVLAYDEKDKKSLYSWIDKSIVYRGKRESLLLYLKAKSGYNMDCFTISAPTKAKFSFTIHYNARKVKNT